MIVPGCYCIGISRSWIVGDEPPTASQKQRYQIAFEHIITNLGLIEAGMSFAEMTNIAHRLAEAYRALRYGVLAHEIGLCDQYPSLRYPEDVEVHGYVRVFEVGITLCVEAYVGAVDEHEGVKLKEQVLVTDRGLVPLLSYRYEAAMLA